MQKNKIFIVADNKIPFLKGILEPFATVEYYNGNKILSNNIKDADALIIRTRTKCNEQLLKTSNVKFISTATIGYDHIDTKYCKRENIAWQNAPGCNAESVKQYFTTALLTLAQEKKIELSAKTIGIIGVGNVGKKIEKTAEILGMKILLNDPPRARREKNNKFCSLEKIKKEADIISFHVPLNKTGVDKTFHLADENFFNGLDRKPILINTSRGEVVETTAIKKAIKNKIISSTVIDVWENEPSIDKELLQLADITTPHIAGYSLDGKANGTAQAVQAVSKFFNLGIEKNWYPESLELGSRAQVLKIDCKDFLPQEIIAKAVLHTYNITEDCNRLKRNYHNFEEQRSNYPVRREFHNYTLVLENADNDLITKLTKLGFKVNES